MEIGQILKEEREAKQLTLDDIQEMTKIQKRYLEAIEDNDFSRLPGRFYARAFIKEYAIVLDLDPNTLLSYFDETNVQEETVQYSNLRRSRRTTTAKSSSILSFLPTVIVIILIVSVLFIAWTLTQKALSTDDNNGTQDNESDQIIRDVDEPEREVPITEEEADEEETDETEEEMEEPTAQSEFNVLEVGQGTSPQSELEFLYAEDELRLSFAVEADAYISVEGGSGTTYFAGILSPGGEIDTYDITDEENIYLNIGNTAGLTILINEVEMEYPVDPQQSVHQKFLIHLIKAE